MSAPEFIPLPDRVRYSDEEMAARARAVRDELARRHSVRDFAPTPVPREVIQAAIEAAATAPSGANLQPWHFTAISDPQLKAKIRVLAEAEERAFYEGKAGAEWLDALAPLGTDASKPFLEIAPWLIAIFGRRRCPDVDGRQRKAYYVPESVSIAAGFLIAALHHAGLATLTHTPSPMGFLNTACGRPDTDKAYLLLVVGHPAANAEIPAYAKRKKPRSEISDFR